jgi:hypothetical protein
MDEHLLHVFRPQKDGQNAPLRIKKCVCPSETSVFLIEFAFVAVRTEQKAGCPWRSSAHLFTDRINGYVHAALDNQLIVHMSADEAVGECPHGVAENIAADCLGNIFHDLRTV